MMRVLRCKVSLVGLEWEEDRGDLKCQNLLNLSALTSFGMREEK